jgi:hypothetical protein
MRLLIAVIFGYSIRSWLCAGREGEYAGVEGRNSMKRMTYLATVALVAMMILVPTAMAQEDTVPGDDDPHAPEKGVVEVGSIEEVPAKEPLPKSGGPAVGSVLLPAGALLLGSGVLAYAVLRRRR